MRALQPATATGASQPLRKMQAGQSALQRAADQSPVSHALGALQRMADARPAIQRTDDEEPMQGKALQLVEAKAARANDTGLPDGLKSGIESLSGMSMDGVKVHRNSDKPAQVGAHACAQGTNIHLAPGQEQHLPHEAWHVVQQAQGRVKPTVQMKGVAINDDAGLENEADVMGAKALLTIAEPVQRHAISGTGAHLRGTTVLQKSAAPTGQVQSPALIGAQNTPLQSDMLDQMGVAATQMSRADYDQWRGTMQCKSSMHGAYHNGDQTTVTRWRNARDVAQLFEFPLSQKMKAGLVMGEAALTIIAGIGGLVAGTGFGAIPLIVPSILALIVGVVKFGRGALMYSDDKPEGKKLALIDVLRTIEALVAGVGALMLDPTSFYKIPSMIFAIAKLVRSLATALADLLDGKGGATTKVFVKGLKALAALAHVVEAVTVGFSAGAGLAEGAEMLSSGGDAATGVSKVASGLAGAGIGGAKAVRAADQSDKVLS